MLRSIAELEQAVAALKPATLSPQQVAPLVRRLGSPELLAELAREDHPEGWPAGWCTPLADMLDRVRGDADQLAPLLHAIDELPPLLQTTLRMELLRLGWFEEDQISDALLEAMIAHTLRQLERPEPPRFFRDALEALALARPEAVWRAELVQAAAQRQGPGYARWPELERHVLPYASSAQRVELACRHHPKPGRDADHEHDRFTTTRALDLCLASNDELGLERAMIIARECERGERQELAHHLIATLGVALMYDARQLPYPPSLLSQPMLTLWRAALRHGPASWEQRLRELLPRMPAALGQTLDLAPGQAPGQAPEPEHEPADDPHELYHPRTGEAVMLQAREGWAQLTWLRPWLGELEAFESVSSDDRSIGALVASAQVRGLRPVPKREASRPEATQHAAGPTSACVNPRDGSLWVIHGGVLRRYDPSVERGHEVMACAQARCLGWAPDGSQLALSDRSIMLLRPSDGRQLELSWPTGTRRAAWSPDSRTLAALPEVDPTRAHLDLDPSVPRTRLPSLVIYDAEHGRLRLERDEREAQRLVFMSPERLLLLSPSRVASVLSLTPGSTPRPGPWLGDGVEHARWIEGGLLMPGPAGELLHLREDPQQGDLMAYGDQHLVAPRWTAKPDHLQLMSLIYDARPDQGWVLLGTLARGAEQHPALALYDLRRGVALACWRPPRDEVMWGQIMLSTDLRRVFYAGADGLWSHALDVDALGGSCFGMVERGVALRPARSAWPGQPRVVEALRGELWSLEELRRSAPDRVRLPSWP